MNETKRASITGIDGTGKTTAVNFVAETLVSMRCTVGVSSSLRSPSYLLTPPSYPLGPATKGYIYPNITAKIARVYEKGQKHNNTFAIMISLISHIFLQQRLVEPEMVRFRPDIIIRDRDPLVDPIVMLKIYGKGKIPIKLMVRLIEAVGGGRITTDHLFLLSLSPEIAFSRTERPTKRDHHETRQKLSEMARLYPSIIQSLMGLGRISDLTTIDTEANGQLSTARMICQALILKLDTHCDD